MNTSLLMLSQIGVTPVLACAVCGGGGLNQQAYIDTMVFLSLLPLALIGGIVLFFWLKSRQVVAVPAAPEAVRRSDVRTS